MRTFTVTHARTQIYVLYSYSSSPSPSCSSVDQFPAQHQREVTFCTVLDVATVAAAVKLSHKLVRWTFYCVGIVALFFYVMRLSAVDFE